MSHSLNHRRSRVESEVFALNDPKPTCSRESKDIQMLAEDGNDILVLPIEKHFSASSCSPFARAYCFALRAGSALRNCFRNINSRVRAMGRKLRCKKDQVQRMREIKPLSKDASKAYSDNTVKNTRYNIYTFLFLNLYDQFRRPLNFYFLLVTAFQFFPSIAPVSPFSTLIPIMFAFILTAIKEGCDDVERYRHDRAYNAKLRLVLEKTRRMWYYKNNASIRVGDVVMLQRNEDIPCDMVAVAASASNVFIRTDNLDGEIDLKLREVVTPPTTVHSTANFREDVSAGNSPNTLPPVAPTQTTFISMNDSVDLLLKKLDCLELKYPPPNSTIDSFDGMAIFDVDKLNNSSLYDIPAAVDREETRQPADVTVNTYESFASGTKNIPLSHSHFLPQSCFLKNTDRIIAVAVYTGNDTKCGMNKRQTPIKCAKIDHDVSRYAMIIFVFQISLSVAFGFVALHKNERLEKRVWYLPILHDSALSLFIIYVMRFFLLTSVMIPLSFKLVVDVSKYYMAKVVVWDKAMVHSIAGPDGVRNVGCSVKNSSILEDLGRIEYVLSDKTGTLTQNIMTLAHIAVVPNHKVCLQHLDLPESVFASSPSEKLKFRLPSESQHINSDDMLSRSHLRSTAVISYEVIDFASMMALCTSVEVIPVKRHILEDSPEHLVSQPTQGGHVVQFTYQAASPDEVALCCGAAKLGVVLQARTLNREMLRIANEDHWYIIHHTFPFSSEFKSMGMIVENVNTARISLIVKGADDRVVSMLIHPLRETHPEMMENLKTYAKEGLRVLLFAERELSREELDLFLARQHRAELELVDRQSCINEIRKEMMRGLKPSGIAAIEDKLQDNVQETIGMMLKGGIKVWMVTGDKMETSEQIALSCGLYRPQDRIIRIAESEDPYADWVKYLMSDDLLSIASSSSSRAFEVLIVQGGRVLDRILSDEPLMERFEKLSMCCLSVICVRTTPGQKAAICHFLRKRGHITLAVGDGGNDVAMLQEANVGVGILGKESVQAARASDFSIAQFDDLRSLIFFHGQKAYVCTSFLIKYSFYKSMLIAFTQLAYTAVYTHYSGQSFWLGFMLLMWNGVYTLPHTLFYCLDRCAPRVVLEHFPSLYNITRKGADLSFKELFLSYLLRGILQSIILLWLMTKIFNESFVFAHSGETTSTEITFSAAYSSILLSQIIMIYTESHSITILNLLVVFFLPFFYLGGTFAYSEYAPHSYYGVFQRTLRPQYVIAVTVTTTTLTLPWVLLKCLRELLQLSRRNILRAEALCKTRELLKSGGVCKTKLEIWFYRLLGFLPEPASLYLADTDNVFFSKEINTIVDLDSDISKREEREAFCGASGEDSFFQRAQAAPTI